MQRTCESVMTRQVHTCTETDTARHAAQLMRKHNVGLIPVINSEHKLVGVVTDRDLALRVLAANRGGNALLKDVMSTSPLVTARPEEALHLAEEKMLRYGTSRAIVTDGEGKVQGIISRAEIARAEGTARTAEVLGTLSHGLRAGAAS